MNGIIPPHGGRLTPLLVKDSELASEREKAGGMTKVFMNSRENSDFIMLASGAFSPLEGFMTENDYHGVLNQMELENGLFWPIPVTLAVSEKEADEIEYGQEVALLDGQSRELMGTMTVQGKYLYNKEIECLSIFKTNEEAHPGVKQLYSQKEVYIGGPVKAFSLGEYPGKYPDFALPAETRAAFKKKGWSKITAFQTRNPIHRSHEYLIKIAMEVSDGVFIHPIVGNLKPGDIPAEVRMDCYKVILDKYLMKDNIVFNVYPMEMRYAGPKEALLHAVIRQNFGCSHIIIGRDHAGVGGYYGPFDAQNIFTALKPGALGIKPLNMDWTFWCYECNEMASLKTCRHPDSSRCMISGTELRNKLKEDGSIKPEFSRPEILEILQNYYKTC